MAKVELGDVLYLHSWIFSHVSREEDRNLNCTEIKCSYGIDAYHLIGWYVL